MRAAAQKPGETPGEGMLPTCAMSLEAAAALLKALGATGLVSPAAEALAKKNPAIQASAKQLAEAGKKMHLTLNGVRCGVVWCGVVWCGAVRCGVVWCGVVRCGVVWCGVGLRLGLA